MSDEDQNKALSKEDAALWEKVIKTLDDPAHAPKQAKTNDQAITARTTTISPELTTTEDFAKLLEGGEAQPTNATASQSLAVETQSSPNKKPVTPQPKIENFSHQEARNISSGKQSIEGMIDLHGCTQAQAEGSLRAFIKRAQGDGKRFVLIITGKGQRRDSHERSFELGAPEPGVLKRKVPHWLDDMPESVLSYKSAHKKHGGEGALYVRLRRFKPSRIS